MQSQSQQNVRFYRNVARTFRVLESISPCFAARCAGRLFSTPIRKPLKEYEVQFLEEEPHSRCLFPVVRSRAGAGEVAPQYSSFTDGAEGRHTFTP